MESYDSTKENADPELPRRATRSSETVRDAYWLEPHDDDDDHDARDDETRLAHRKTKDSKKSVETETISLLDDSSDDD